MPTIPTDFPQTGQKLYLRAKRRIPGGTQLLSKRPEMFLPGGWPAYYSRAEGCRVWDMDDRPFVDFTSCGIGCCLLGYADPTVNAAVGQAIARGTMCTLNAPEEVALADLLCELHPWAEQARFARAGGEAMSIAVRLARAHTGRSRIAFCGYHGWADWYLAANLGETAALDGHLLPGLSPRGVPPELRGTALPFRYNHVAELEAIASAHRGQVAAIVMEPMRHEAPRDGFLKKVRALADEMGAVLVFDEITSGWRAQHGGIHLGLEVAPDIAVFAKAISNGFPMAAVIGRGAVMDAAQGSFVSSTYWTERLGPTAALATLEKLRATRATEQIARIGDLTREGWRKAGQASGVAVKVGGTPALCTFAFDQGESSRAVMTLFTQGMLERGFLANGAFYPTLAHREEDVAAYLRAVNEVFGWLKTCLARNTVIAELKGGVAHASFARLT